MKDNCWITIYIKSATGLQIHTYQVNADEAFFLDKVANRPQDAWIAHSNNDPVNVTELEKKLFPSD
jgi:hypothetical protein